MMNKEQELKFYHTVVFKKKIWNESIEKYKNKQSKSSRKKNELY